jgi:hypothetical protein
MAKRLLPRCAAGAQFVIMPCDLEANGVECAICGGQANRTAPLTIALWIPFSTEPPAPVCNQCVDKFAPALKTVGAVACRTMRDFFSAEFQHERSEFARAQRERIELAKAQRPAQSNNLQRR